MKIRALFFLAAMMSLTGASSIDQRIEKYILAHPDVIVKALELHSHKLINDRLQSIIQNEDTNIVLANPKASGQLVAFIDYQCGACKRSFHIVEQFAQDHPDIKLIIRPLPILGSESTIASLLAYDAASNSDGLKLTHTLLELKEKLDNPVLKRVASGYKLQVSQNPRDHWAFEKLAENYRQSSVLNNQSVPLYILSIDGQAEMFSGISSQHVLEEAYQRLV